VEAVAVDGSTQVLPAEAYAIDIDTAGDGWVRARPAGGQGLLTVRYEAGLAAAAEGLPEPIRQGIVRLAAEQFGVREGEVATPPAAVGALWRPWRRMRLA
jgi:uncharacterized phiE125 gp8 family phage protein